MRGQSAIHFELAVHTKQVKEGKLNLSVCRDRLRSYGMASLSCHDLNLAKT